MIAPTRTPDQIKFVAIHHSAVKGIPANKAELMRRLRSHEEHHSTKEFPNTRGEHGFTFLLYHFAIAGNGEYVQAQDARYALWTNTDNYKGAESCNRWGFSILLEGNFETDTPTPEQLETAAQIIHSWNEVNNRKLIIKGHKEYSAPRFGTACPGKNMGVSTQSNSRLSWIINRVNELDGIEMPPINRTAVVTASAGLNLRSGPSTSNPVIAAMPYKSVVSVIQTQGNWTNVEYQGIKGWAYSPYLRIEATQPPVTPPSVSEGKDEVLLAIQYYNKRLASTTSPQRKSELRLLKDFANERLETLG